MNERAHIFIATPCYGGLVTQTYMQSVIALMHHAATAGFDLSLAMLGHDALITRSRNTLLGQFMDSPSASHILFIDADIGFEAAHVERMLAFGKDVVAGIYPLKTFHFGSQAQARMRAGEPIATAGMLYVGCLCKGDELEHEDGFATGVYAGTGFMLIRRNVITRMIEAYPETRYSQIHAFPFPERKEGPRYALFDCMIDPASGVYLSEDYAFCKRWRDIGGKIWLDTKSRLTHSGPFDFHGNPALRYGAYEPA